MIRFSVTFVFALWLALLVACGDSTAPEQSRPTTIQVVVQVETPPTAGVVLPSMPAFVVKDEQGNTMAGVAVSVSVTAGGGSLVNAPSITSSGSTPIGQWTMGAKAGVNSVTINVAGIAPAILTVTSTVGAAAKLVAVSPTSQSGTVGQAVPVSPSATVTDAFDNPVPGATVSVVLAGGGAAAPSITADGSGVATVPAWTLGTAKGTNTLTMSLPGATLEFFAAAAAGPIHTIAVISGGTQTAAAGTALGPVKVAPVDQYGNRLDNQTAAFAVVAGGGSLAGATAQSAPDGSITMPVFTLGKSVVPQRVQVTVGTKAGEISAAVETSYEIDIRFWGEPMSQAHKELFDAAAARIRAFVVGSVPVVDATGADPSACGVSGMPVLNEWISGVLIYASVQTMDGPGKVLASAGPCFIRSNSDVRTVVGVMQFDIADMQMLSNQGRLQDVMTHEMLHVVGVGSFWNYLGLLTGYDTPGVAYTGAGGVAGCALTGAGCLSSVPVENTGGGGTANSHWRETVFGSELMTGFANSGAMPISQMTIRSLEDLGYIVNAAAADAFSVTGALRRSDARIDDPAGGPWERPLPKGPFVLPSRGGPLRAVSPR